MVLLRLAALLLTALVLVPSGAHLFELPGKIGLGAEEYLTVQGIYAGWALFGLPIVGAILANLSLCVAERRRAPAHAAGAAVAALLLAASLGVFVLWILPGNRATANWTRLPETWEALRRRWEYGHAAGAILVAAALVATALSVVQR